MQITTKAGPCQTIYCSLIILTLCTCTVCGEAVKLPADLPFVMPQLTVPEFKDQSFLITDYGAVSDGQTKNTEAFAKAISACAEASGGQVTVPAGIWITGPITLKSRVNLHLLPGSLILFSTDIDDYPMVPKTWEGSEAIRRMSPITAENLENIAITGSGIIDGSGQVWRHVKKDKLTESQWKKLTGSGGVVDSAGRIWYPSEQSMNGSKTVKTLRKRNAEPAQYAAAGEHLRPVMVSLVNCKNVLLDGPTFQNSPAWNIHPLLCENVIIRNLNVRNPRWSQNGDGLDVESCKNVLVSNCRFDVGDDAICMKSGRDEYGRQRGRATENVIIEDCIVYHGHGGFTVGSEMSGGVRNVLVRNCNFLGTDIGLRFKSTRDRGGEVEDIYIEDIFMTDIPTDAIRFNLFYSQKFPGAEKSLDSPPDPVTEQTPRFQRIHMKNILCRGAKRALYMQGLPEMPIRQITFENVTLLADTGVLCIETEDITFKNFKILPKEDPAFGLYNARQMHLDSIDMPADAKVNLILAGEKTKAVEIKNTDKTLIENKLEFKKGADSTALSL